MHAGGYGKMTAKEASFYEARIQLLEDRVETLESEIRLMRLRDQEQQDLIEAAVARLLEK
jgi:hypothetical protein